MKLHSGLKIGRLTLVMIVGHRESGGKKRAQWQCLCECGNTTVVDRSNLSSNHTTSCGCFLNERRSESHTTHGHTKGCMETVFYRTWKNIRQRCSDPNHPSWEFYGARGIKVLYSSFAEFLLDMKEGWREGLSIDRKDTNGNYEPGNCKWSTPKEQANNRRKRRWHKKPEDVK